MPNCHSTPYGTTFRFSTYDVWYHWTIGMRRVAKKTASFRTVYAQIGYDHVVKLVFLCCRINIVVIMAFGFAAVCYIIALILTAFLIFFVIFHVSVKRNL